MMPLRAPELETPRLRLVPFAPGDEPAILAYASDARFFEHLPERPDGPYRPSHAAEHLRHLLDLARGGWPAWRIELKGGPARGTTVGAVRLRPAGGAAELGYGVAPAQWGRGYATEACSAAVAWARGEGEQVVARCAAANTASLRVLAKLGFVASQPGGDGRATVWHHLPVSPTPAAR